MTRPFKILGLQQVAIGAQDKGMLSKLWVDLLGLRVEQTYQSEAENVIEDILRLGEGIDSVELDLMQPLDTDKKPRPDLPALNHIGLWVDDLHAANAWLESEGVRMAPGGIRKGAAGHEVCFIHPKPSEDKPHSGQGVLIELVQAPQEILRAKSQPSNKNPSS